MSRRSPLIAAGLLVALVAAGCGSDSKASSSSDGSATNSKAQVIEVTLTEQGCDPHEISAKEGPTTFKISNEDAADVTEFEILKGNKILGEKENIAPGLDGDFSLNLKAGSYKTHCTGGTKKDGTLEVAKSGTGKTGDTAARDASVKTYLTYVQSEADQLVPATQAFADAVTAGDIEKAKSLFAGARYHYETIEPIAESFGDLDPKIDARAGDVPDDQWTGFHRIEKAIFEDNTTEGMEPVASGLVTNVKDLQAKIASIELEPSQVANGAVELLNEVSASKITGEEDRYSGTDLSDFAANVEGAKQAFDAVKPLLAGTQDELVTTIDGRFADVTTALDVYKDPASIGNGYAIYTTIKDDDSKTSVLSAKVDALAEPLSKVAALVLQ